MGKIRVKNMQNMEKGIVTDRWQIREVYDIW